MLLPTALVFLLYVYAYWGGLGQIAYCASGEYKFGYWFTFALFLMNVLHYGVSLVVARWCGRGERGVLLALVVVALALIVLKDWDWTQNGATLAQLVSLRLIAMHLPYYIMGMVCRRRQDVFHRIVNNDYVVGAVMVAFAIGVAHDGGGFWIGMIMGVLGVVLLYRMCYRYQNVFSDDTLAGRQLCMIGRNTLQIYLIHYFFFLGLKLPQLGAILDAPAMWVAKISVASVLAVAIAYGCIGVMKVVQMSKPLSRILIGK